MALGLIMGGVAALAIGDFGRIYKPVNLNTSKKAKSNKNNKRSLTKK